MIPKTVIPMGQRFNSWEVIADGPGSLYICQCKCGTVRRIRAYDLTSGRAKSCRTCRPYSTNNFKHGESSSGNGKKASPEYVVWRGIHQRAGKHPNYLHVRIAPEWMGSEGFKAFLDHVGRRPSTRHSLDRIRNEGNYEPGNVRWATPLEQSRNRGFTRQVTFAGKTQCVSAWAEETGISKFTILYRLDHGWDVERTLTQPVTDKFKAKRR